MALIQCQCGNSFSVKDQFAGLPVGCPNCSMKHTVPKPVASFAPEPPLEVQPMGAPIGGYPQGMGKPKANNNVGIGIAIVLGVTGVAAIMLLVGSLFIARSFKTAVDEVQAEVADAVLDSPAFEPESPLDSRPPQLRDATIDQQNQPVAKEDTVRLVPQDQIRRAPRRQGRVIVGRQGAVNNDQSRRRQIYRAAKIRLRGPEQILQRQMQSRSRVPDHVRAMQQQSVQRIIDSAKKSLCSQYNLTPFELESIIQEGNASNW